jgi:ribose transport system permease protein
VLLGLATGAACGLANGLLSVGLRIPTIIITLGTMGVYRGLALRACASAPISKFPKTSALFTVGGQKILGLPAGVVVMVAAGVVGYIVLNHTPFGWRVQAIGSNPQAARFSGIPIGRYRVAVTALMGAVAGLAGLTTLAYSGTANPAAGGGYELFVIAATIIGGTALTGGSGSVPGAVLGALVIAVIDNGIGQLGWPPEWSVVARGGIIIAAVAVSVLVKGRAGRG